MQQSYTLYPSPPSYTHSIVFASSTYTIANQKRLEEARSKSSAQRHQTTQHAGSGARRATSHKASHSRHDSAALDSRLSRTFADLDSSCQDSADPLVRLQQMVHPLFSKMQQPSEVALNGLYEAVENAYVLGPSSYDMASSINQRAKDIAPQLQSASVGKRVIHLNCGDDVPVEFLLAVISMGMFLAHVEEPLSFKLKMTSSSYRQKVCDAWRRWQKHALDYPISPIQKGNWLCSDNSPDSRLLRQAIAAATLFRGYQLGSTRRSVHGTHFVRPGTVRAGYQRTPVTSITTDPRLALDVAVYHARCGKRVAVVIAASAFQVGGGFLTGGRHALEESMCTQSTLFFSLLQASRERQQLRFRTHVPETGAILSPDVEVFRNGTAQGYESISPVELAAVLSIAMPNQNPCVHNNPTYSGSPLDYEKLVEQKFRAVLEGAYEVKAEVLIFPDVGCGVFKNDPCQVGKILGDVFASDLRTPVVILVGSDEFSEAVRAQYNRKRQTSGR